MKNDLTTGAWQHDIGCPIKIVLVSTSDDGLSIPRNLGIYTPLRQHSQCGENNIQLDDIRMIYMEKRKRENLRGKTCGLMERSEQGIGLSTHQGPVTCMRASMGFVVGVQVVFGVVISPVLGTCIPVIMKLILGCPTMEPPKLHIHHLGPEGDNSLDGNSCCCRVTPLDRTFWLGPTHGNEGLVVGNHFLCRDEQRC
jgi:hypothetical protein